MSVLEICQLRLKKGVLSDDPSLLENLSAVRSILKTKSRFYHCVEWPSLIFILGIWPSLAHHEAFLSSPEKDAILGAQQDQLEFNWMSHVELDSLLSLPLDAPVLAITRWCVKDGHHEGLSKVVEKCASIVRELNCYNVSSGWGCDSEPGKQEIFMFTGWASVDQHEVFTDKMRKVTEQADVASQFEEVEIMCTRNMETSFEFKQSTSSDQGLSVTKYGH